MSISYSLSHVPLNFVISLQIDDTFRSILQADEALTQEEKIQAELKHEKEDALRASEALEKEKVMLQVRNRR